MCDEDTCEVKSEIASGGQQIDALFIDGADNEVTTSVTNGSRVKNRQQRRKQRKQIKNEYSTDETPPKRRLGRPPKKPPVEIEEQPSVELLKLWSDEEDAECVPNGIKAIQCFICGEQMSKIYKLREHMQQHEKLESYDNKLLETVGMTDILNPQRHNIETSVIRDFVIQEVRAKRYSQFYGILNQVDIELDISDSETDSEVNCNEEIAGKIPHNTYKCDLCQLSFDRRYKALFHQRNTHSSADMYIVCDYCARQFSGVQLYIHHLKTKCESDEHPITCVERFRKYLLKYNLEQLECLAQARKDLKMHRLTNAEKIYECKICQKTFLRSEHLTRHKSVHLPDAQKMECPVCFRKFNRKDNLRTHMRVHLNEAERDTNNEQPILCQYCGHCFTSKSNYVVHMRRHTGENPYSCDVCGKGFPKSTDLNSHKITHTGERNFICSICNKAFARSAVLSKHMRRVHMGVGPYHCTYCDQAFQRPNELANHLRQHAVSRNSGNEGSTNDAKTAEAGPLITNTTQSMTLNSAAVPNVSESMSYLATAQPPNWQ